MIKEYQKKFALLANKELGILFEKDTEAYNQAQVLVLMLVLGIKPILEEFREDVDIINQKIKDNSND